MERKNALVKVSGGVFKKKKFIEFLRTLSETYYLGISIGGGKQINEEFKKRGFPIKFGPLGREIENEEQAQLVRDTLEKNKTETEDLLHKNKIQAVVDIPVRDYAGVLCPFNGDLAVKLAYLRYDVLYVITTNGNYKKKKEDFKDVDDKEKKIKIKVF